VSGRTVRRLEEGTTLRPRLVTVESLANFYGLDPDGCRICGSAVPHFPAAARSSPPPTSLSCRGRWRTETHAGTSGRDRGEGEAQAAVDEGRGHHEQHNRGGAGPPDENGCCPGEHQDAADQASKCPLPSWVIAGERRRGHRRTSPAAASSHGLDADTARGAAGTELGSVYQQALPVDALEVASARPAPLVRATGAADVLGQWQPFTRPQLVGTTIRTPLSEQSPPVRRQAPQAVVVPCEAWKRLEMSAGPWALVSARDPAEDSAAASTASQPNRSVPWPRSIRTVLYAEDREELLAWLAGHVPRPHM
jgi:hypothetical protein